ncbi:hypothetical protein NA56DRAFT_649384 [Hyaloscypha hepaticicola]|uniref:Uncharacterized protein n=1 Tax=Hyaloscypha hepaticicola TaxID=2082293 RepID=A0A2J6PR71_9HELO|nr:hypothetical protein NA56DRAFT_649384 [Hyaloscypha hepaticicola]
MSDENSIREAVCTWASRNTCLLLRLSMLSEAHNDYNAQLTYVNRLQESIREQNVELRRVQEEVETRFKVHKSFCDRIAPRIFHRTVQAQEKYEANSSKAEEEYFEALGAQSRAKARRVQLESDLEEAVRTEGELKTVVQEHDEVRNEIDELYERLFGGPTPGFPEEDVAEDAVKTAKAENEATKERIRRSREALRLLNLAQERLQYVEKYLTNAYRLGKKMVLFVDDTFNSVRFGNKKRSEAMNAIRDTHTACLSAEAVLRKETLIQQLESAKVYMDKSHSRDAILSAISAAHDIVSEARKSLRQLIEEVRQERDALADINKTAKQLEYATQELWLVRQEIFEKVAGFGQAPPCYSYDKPAPDYSSIVGEVHEQVHGCQIEMEV